MENQPLISLSAGDMTAISVFENKLELSVGSLGITRKIGECELSQVSRVTQSTTLLENKCKLVIYYMKDGKEKRLGGFGQIIEGSLSEPEFAKFIEILKSKLPETALWQDKLAEKIEKSSKDGFQKFNLSPVTRMLFFKKYHHSGERMIYVVLYTILHVILLGLGLFLAIGVYLETGKMGVESYIISTVIGLLMVFFSLKSFILLFSGGMYKLLLSDSFMKINHRYFGKTIHFQEISEIDYTIIKLRTRNNQNYNVTESYEYEFVVLPQKMKFVIGEMQAKILIDKLKEKGLKVKD